MTELRRALANLSLAALTRLDGLLSRGPDALLAAITIYLLACLSIEAWRKPLWTDEFITYYVATQPSVTELVQAIVERCDTAPPLYALLVRPLLGIIPSTSFALRLPSILGFGLMVFCVFRMLGRRLPVAYAAACTLSLATTMHEWAMWARPYGIVMGCSALALLCWQSARGERRILALLGLGLALTIGTAAQYYTVFITIALLAGEFVRWRKSGKLDLAGLAVIATPALALLIHLPLILSTRHFIPNFWGKASWEQVTYIPWQFAALPTRHLLATLAVYGLAVAIFGMRDAAAESHGPTPVDEVAAVVALGMLLALIPALSILTTGAFVDRYALPGGIGIAMLLFGALHRVGSGRRVLAVSLVLAFLGWTVLSFGRYAALGPHLRYGQGAMDLLMTRAPALPLPILVPDDHAFMELWHYAPAPLRSRLVHPISAALERQYLSTDSSAQVFAALRRRTSLPVAEYERFVETKQVFLLCATRENWIVWHLQQQGFHLKALHRNGHELYEVTPGGK